MSGQPKKMIGSPLETTWRVALGLLPIVILALLYAHYSHQRQLENPLDRLMPGFDQLREGLVAITTPNKRTGEIWLVKDTMTSLGRLAKGMGSGLIIAVVTGLAMGIFSRANALLAPVMTALAKVPPLALLPIIFIFLGVDEKSKLVLIALGIVPTLTNDIALAGRGVPRETVVKAYTLGASTIEVALKAIFPQIMPRILDSIRLTIGPAWIFLIAAEAISADSGLGYRIYVVQRQLAMNVILPYVVWIALIGVSMDLIISTISKRAFPWAHPAKGH